LWHLSADDAIHRFNGRQLELVVCRRELGLLGDRGANFRSQENAFPIFGAALHDAMAHYLDLSRRIDGFLLALPKGPQKGVEHIRRRLGRLKVAVRSPELSIGNILKPALETTGAAVQDQNFHWQKGLILSGLIIWLGGRGIALQRVMVVAKIFAGVVQVPGIGRMAEVAFLLSSAGVLGPGVARGGAEEERAREGGSQHQNFKKPIHNVELVRASMPSLAKPWRAKRADKLSHLFDKHTSAQGTCFCTAAPDQSPSTFV
jgi:hypothetical protein